MSHDTLTAIDASFLVAERPGFPLHIGGIAVFEGGRLVGRDGHLRIDVIRRLIEGHLHRLPRFRQKVLPAPLGLRLPQWVDAPQFDVADHVKVVRVDPPGTDEQLFALAVELNKVPLDRTKPLWEMWFVEGLEGRRFALVDKVHHALVDGVSGAESLVVLLDPDPDAKVPEPEAWQPAVPPAPLRHLADTLVDALTAPLASLGGRPGVSLRPPSIQGLTTQLTGWARLAQPTRFAPGCSLNGPVGDGREYAVVRQSLDEVKHIGRTFGAKVNDVVLAAVTSGLRRLLDERGELAGVPYVQALVPVSVRSDDERLSLGNKVSALFARLPVQVDDPLDRLEQLRSGMTELKAGSDAPRLAAVLGTADTWPPALLSAVSELTVHRQPFVNLVVTNVPGPPMPLYVLGSRMTECHPYVPLSKNLTIGVAILSYNGQLSLAVTSDPVLAPDAGVLVGGIADGFAELAALAAA